MIPFENFWEKLAFSLIRAQIINHWKADGKKGDRFQAQYKGGSYVFCIVENGGVLKVPKKEFRFMYDKWDKHTSERLCGTFVEDESRFTKYTASVIHQFLHLS